MAAGVGIATSAADTDRSAATTTRSATRTGDRVVQSLPWVGPPPPRTGDPEPREGDEPGYSSSNDRFGAVPNSAVPLLLHHHADVALPLQEREAGDVAVTAEQQRDPAVADPEVLQLHGVQPHRELGLVHRHEVLVGPGGDAEHALQDQERRPRGPRLGRAR